MKNTYETGASRASGVHSEKATFLLFGLIGEKDVDLKALCPEGVAWFRDYTTFGDGCLTMLTCSIYTPRTIEVQCTSGSAYLAVPDASEGVTWVYDVPANELGGAE
jgi:hypothetical protein